jgi:hypothetical protein
MEKLRPYRAWVVASCDHTRHTFIVDLPARRAVINGRISRQKIGATAGVCRANTDGLPCGKALRIEYVLEVRGALTTFFSVLFRSFFRRSKSEVWRPEVSTH